MLAANYYIFLSGNNVFTELSLSHGGYDVGALLNLGSGSGRPLMGRSSTASLSLACLSGLLALSGAVPANGQAMMEYGGLMAAPKGVPSGAANALATPYRNIPNMFPGQSGSGSASGNSGGSSAAGSSVTTPIMTTTDGQENKGPDPKKIQEEGNKALADYQKAKSKMHSSNPEDLKAAEALLRSAINSRNSIWGYSDPVIPAMLNDLGGLYAKQNHTDTAIGCYKSALVYITKQKGSGSYERLDTMLKLGKLLRSKGEHREALNYLKQAALINERQSGKENVKTIETKLDWAREADQLSSQEADLVYKDCLNTFEHIDPSSPEQKSAALLYDTLKSSLERNYSDYLRRQGRAQEADELKEKLKVSTEAAAGEDTPAAVVRSNGQSKAEPGAESSSDAASEAAKK